MKGSCRDRCRAEPVAILRGDCERVRYIRLFHEAAPLFQQRPDFAQLGGVQRIRGRDIDRLRHPADEIRLRMRVFSPQEGMQPHIRALELERVEVMADGQQVHLRLEPIGGVAQYPFANGPSLPPRTKTRRRSRTSRKCDALERG